jgi:F0F1-type ATP synthase assembly protein I
LNPARKIASDFAFFNFLCIIQKVFAGQVEMRGTWKSLGLLFRLSALTLGAAFGSLLLGIALDRFLNTAPFGTLCLMIVGILIGTISVYRTVQREYQSIAAQVHRNDNGGK